MRGKATMLKLNIKLLRVGFRKVEQFRHDSRPTLVLFNNSSERFFSNLYVNNIF